MIIKRCEARGNKVKYCECCVEYRNVKINLIL